MLAAECKYSATNSNVVFEMTWKRKAFDSLITQIDQNIISSTAAAFHLLPAAGLHHFTLLLTLVLTPQ